MSIPDGKESMMKKTTMLILSCLLMGAGAAQAQLKIDFSQAGGAVEAGYEAYVANHEVANTFTSQTFAAFGTNVTVTPTWAANATAAAMQMIDRSTSGRNGYTGEHADLLNDWIGTDTRQVGNPMTLTISGLPQGTYSWLSYHHDTDDQTGIFNVTISDATGSNTTTGVDISHSEAGTADRVDGFENITVFSATIVSNGADIVLAFEVTSPSDPVNTAFFVMNGFELDRQIIAVATSPSPASGATDVPTDVTLGWTGGMFAATHDVYFGTSLDDVENASVADPRGVLVARGQADMTYDPGRLELEQTYYWRVDEVNAPPDSTVVKGWVWSFTTEPVAYPAENVIATSNGISEADVGPENVVNGSGLSADDQHSIEGEDMWLASPAGDEPLYIQFELDRVYKLHQMLVWNYNVRFEPVLGFGLKDVTVEYSSDGADWMVLGDVTLAQGTAKDTYTYNTTVDLGGVAAKYVKLTVNSGYGLMGQFGLSEVRLLYIPAQAREPQPASGTVDVGPDAVLSWRAGRGAVTHQVYLSTDEQAVVDGTALADTVSEPALNADGLLELGRTYYWKVNEINEAQTPPSWEGEIWSFSTQSSILVDDFESYNDEDNTIFDTWIDGWVNDTGSTVGYMNSPFAEQTIIHGGSQSMPLFYDSSSAAVSEATRTFDDPQDWTRYGVKALTLWFFGDPSNTVGQMYVKVNGKKVLYGGDAGNLLIKPWQLWYIDLADFAGVNLRNVTEVTIGLEGGNGLLLIDDIALSPLDRRSVVPAEPASTDLVGHFTFEGNANDSSGTRNGTIVGSPAFAAGRAGQAIELDGIADYVRIEGSYNLPTYSASLWFRVDGGTGERDLLSVYNSAGAHGILLELRSNGTLRFLHRAPVAGSGGTDIYSTATADDGTWYHAGIVRTTQTMTLYINGEVAGTADSNTEFDQALQNVTIGVLKHDNLTRYFPGAIDEVYLYGRALSHGEIAWLAGRTNPFDTP
jgi:hypothetical protein